MKAAGSADRIGAAGCALARLGEFGLGSVVDWQAATARTALASAVHRNISRPQWPDCISAPAETRCRFGRGPTPSLPAGLKKPAGAFRAPAVSHSNVTPPLRWSRLPAALR